jgi:hypothetical protein
MKNKLDVTDLQGLRLVGRIYDLHKTKNNPDHHKKGKMSDEERKQLRRKGKNSKRKEGLSKRKELAKKRKGKRSAFDAPRDEADSLITKLTGFGGKTPETTLGKIGKTAAKALTVGELSALGIGGLVKLLKLASKSG